MAETPIRKVAAVVLRAAATDLLVFAHPDEAGVTIQLPAGTVEDGEAPETAAARELLEETGVRGEFPRLAGVLDENADGEARRRWVYLFDAPAGLPDEWASTCDCGAML